MQNVALHYVEIEEEYHEQQGKQRTESDDFHGQIPSEYASTFSSAFLPFISLAARLTALLMMPHERDDTDDTGHGNTSDTDALGIFLEDKFG